MRTKNIFNPKGILLLILVGTIGMTGCKKFLDINQNPNNPDSADPTLLLPTVQAAVGQIIGNGFQTYGGMYAQYWTQSPNSSQYKTIDQYNAANSAFDRPWLTLYRNALINAQLIIENKGASLDAMKGMAYIMKAYAFQVTTDAFGDIPLSESLKGTQFGSPHYDAQELVYDSIFTFIDKGKALLAVPSASPGAQDIIFQGDIPSWKAFANTLKLRAYLRIVKVNPAKAEAGIKALYAEGATFLTKDAAIKYNTIGGNENPLYNEMVSPTLNKVQNLVASSTAFNKFKANGDLRVNKFYDLETGQTDLNAIKQGTFAASGVEKVVSKPSSLVGGNATNSSSATAPVKLMSLSESNFLQAEAAVRGYATGVDAEALLKLGIQNSFVATGLTSGDGTTYYTAAADGAAAWTAATTEEAKVKVVIVQKYYALCGFQGFEAWTEYRRTGYPNFLIQSAASTIGVGRLPLRFVYPNSEAITNLNFPGNITVYTPVWWGKNTTITPAP
ncbi:SusD/RagB family nutrient-binding outer membrane lipoprotein [Pedobacter sp. B4-66]|uniref:SusD/RagB family nutrient-binding outer membrane lipoprotein n=1 Tax=Pedobacter sp. B4-66 TaxID=2817280 RepID=UPI001BDAA8FD|nr:SusD/RagB family nutrient-binding outer membrane lipoprotein [Pedobacter sp. B4-66]